MGHVITRGAFALAVAAGALGCSGERELELRVVCDDYRGLRGRAYAVTPGSEFLFSLEYERTSPRDNVPVLDLVDAPGFTLSVDPEQDGFMRAVAPAEPGVYTWTIENGEPAEFLVYDPDQVQPTLGELPPAGGIGRAAVLGLSVGDGSVCVHDREEIAVVTVAGEGCRTVLSGFEIEAPLRAAVGDGSFELELLSDGRCEVTAELANGQRVTRQYEPAGAPVEELEPPENIVSEATALRHPIGPGDPCASAPIDGDCEFPYYDDGDCYWDADWGIRHHDPLMPEGEPLASGATVGVGLTTRLEVYLEAFSIVIGPPKNLMYEQASGGLSVRPLDCDGDFKLVTVEPVASGEHEIEFRSVNTADVGRTILKARPVAETQFAFETESGSLGPGEQVVEVFVHTQASVTASYRDAEGGRLYGTAPIAVTTSDPTAMSGVTDPDILITGDSPHTLVLHSAVTPQTLTVEVRDESSITAMEGLEEPMVSLGEEHCVQPLIALGAGGVPIHGRPPKGPRVSVAGDALVFTRRAIRGGLCLRGIAPSESTLSWSWGTATEQTRWVVGP